MLHMAVLAIVYYIYNTYEPESHPDKNIKINLDYRNSKDFEFFMGFFAFFHC